MTIFEHFWDYSTLAQIKRRWHKRVSQVYEILRIWVLENVMDTTRPAGQQKTGHFEKSPSSCINTCIRNDWPCQNVVMDICVFII